MDRGKQVRAVEYGQYVTVRVPEKTGISDGSRLVRLGIEQHGLDRMVAMLRLHEARVLARAILALTADEQDAVEGEYSAEQEVG